MRNLIACFVILTYLCVPCIAQYNPLQVSSSVGTGTYNYVGMFNGKPRYMLGAPCSTITISTTCDAYIGGGPYEILWNGSAWQWEAGGGCVWLFNGCTDASGTLDTAATNQWNTMIPPQLGWTAVSPYTIPIITYGDSCNIIDQPINQDTIACAGIIHAITIAVSQPEVIYYLRDNSTNAVISGPAFGNGSPITLGTGIVNTTTTFQVYAQSALDSTGCNTIMSDLITVTILPGASSIDAQTACNSFTWMDGNTYSSSTNSPAYVINGGAANGCDSIITLNLTINSVSVITTTTSGNVITANNGNATYVWLNCDSNFAVIPGETNASYAATSDGNYAVALTENGCTDTSACVNMLGTPIIQNSFSNTFTVYPNPVVNDVLIHFESTVSKLDYSLSNSAGQLVKSGTLNNSRELQLTLTVAPGIYFLELHGAAGEIAMIRLVKQ